MDTTTGNFTQLTHSTGGHFNLEPSIDAVGTRIAFVSTADLTGDNPDGNSELFLVDTTTGTFTQLTSSTGDVSSGQPSINALGTRIAFISSADLTGDNPDGNAEFFLADTTTGNFTQLTSSTGSVINTGPSINALGTRIAFATTADLTGDNPDGTEEIFLADTTTGRLTQLTHSTLGTGFPSINALGTRIAFGSSSNLTGDNPDGNQEIFVVDTTRGSFTQLTSSTGSSSLPSINAVGARVAFVSNADLTGGNADRNFELFLVDTTRGSFTQLTTGGVIFSSPSINATGTRIAFIGSADLTGDNPDGNTEIFLATCIARGNKGKEKSDP